MLQPVAEFPHIAVGMIPIEVKKEVGRKELELVDQSSAARAAAGTTKRSNVVRRRLDGTLVMSSANQHQNHGS